MPLISYADIRDFWNSIRYKIELDLNKLTECLYDGRNESNIPIYTITHRVKTIDSLFLKVRRKEIKAENINDLGGLKVLCLFDDDILCAHKLIIETLHKKEYNLYDCTIYNWENNNTNNINNTISQHFPGYKAIILNNNTRYKSIHYNIRKTDSFGIEIQLCTLINDISNQIREKFIYKKGSIDFYLDKSMPVLYDQLVGVNSLINYSKALYDAAKSRHFLKQKPSSISPYLTHDLNIKPCDNYHQFDNHIKTYSNFINKSIKEIKDSITDSAKKSTENALKDLLDNKDKFNDHELKEIEKCLLKQYAITLFCSEKYLELKEHCLIYIERFGDDPTISSMMGELYLFLNMYKEALLYFEAAINALDTSTKNALKMALKIKTRIAYIYYSLGSDFLNLTINCIDEAEQILLQNKDFFSKDEIIKLDNNICWYYLSYYIHTKNQELPAADFYFTLAHEKYKMIENIYTQNKGNISKNMIDTMAWFSYQLYLRTRDKYDLEKAKKFCRILTSNAYINAAKDNITAEDMHNYHIKTILSTE